MTLDGTGRLVDLNSAALDIDASGAITIDGTSTAALTTSTSITATSPVTSIVASDYMEIKALTNAAELRFYEPSDALNRTYIALQAGNVSGDGSAAVVTLTLPVDDGTANQVLKTDGDGILRWDNDNTSAAASQNANSIGTNSSSENVTMTYNGTDANDGVITWYHNSGTGYFGMDNTCLLYTSPSPRDRG